MEVKRKISVGEVEANTTTGCIVEDEIYREDNLDDEVVVIGEGEDHRYCCLPVLPLSSFCKQEQCCARNEGVQDSRDAVTTDAQKTIKQPNVYVQSDRTWKFRKTTVVATCNENGQLLYHPDPFSPVPPSKASLNAVKRMEYAARRIDNRKYRAQRSKVLASDNLDSATCSKCHMRFFLPFRYIKSRITYLVPESPYLLPIPQFHCPLCEEDSIIEL